MNGRGPVIDFYYGIGSRYSYLASTRLVLLRHALTGHQGMVAPS
ncbi:MAG: hypothetical protein WD673_02785 [Alphaproteobacteria bacterium]